jgi:hypothetical protein
MLILKAGVEIGGLLDKNDPFSTKSTKSMY